MQASVSIVSAGAGVYQESTRLLGPGVITSGVITFDRLTPLNTQLWARLGVYNLSVGYPTIGIILCSGYVYRGNLPSFIGRYPVQDGDLLFLQLISTTVGREVRANVNIESLFFSALGRQ